MPAPEPPDPIAPPPAVGAGAPLAPGTLVDGKYAVEGVIGEGGMGIVYLARDIHAETRIVLKAIRGEYVHRKDFRERILAEGRALSRIDHPNVVRLNAIVVSPEGLYLVMQYVEGESLGALIARHAAAGQPLPVHEALRLFRQVVEGVAAAHREGIIHRDLKPENILIRARDGGVKVTDFGIAKEEQAAKEGRGNTKGVIGSVLYMAPEQCLGSQHLDKRVDIYALGIILFQLLAGRVPFDAPSDFEVMTMHVKEPLPRIATIRPDVPYFLDDLLERACAKATDMRFSSCEELLAALDRGRGRMAETALREPYGPGQTQTLPSPTTPAARQQVTIPQGPLLPIEVRAAHEIVPRIARPSETPEKARRSDVVMLGAVIAAAAAAGLGGAYALGWLAPEKPATIETLPSAPAAPAPSASSAPPALALLEGRWKSDSGRHYDAVWTGQSLEFRIHDPGQFPGQGYTAGEPRFTLLPIANEKSRFGVQDQIRPYAPAGTSYDLSLARGTCHASWFQVGGRPLSAEIEGERLRVRMALVEPAASMFETRGQKVVGCRGLSAAPAKEVESVLVRQ